MLLHQTTIMIAFSCFSTEFCICRFFDRDVECIYKFFNKRFVIYGKSPQNTLIQCAIFIGISFLVRFNLTSEKNEEQDESETEGEDNGRPSFLSVKMVAGSLDKELAASGFTRKEQVEMEKVGQMFLQIRYSCIHL
jgi:RIO kinase 2